MDDSQSLLRIKLFVRIIGVLFALIGIIGFVVAAINWSSISILSLAFTLGVYFLMLMGGGLLLAFRQGGLEVVFIILRLNILLGVGTFASGIVASQSGTIIFGGSILVIVIGLMIFLSQNNVKSLFGNKT